MNKNMRRFVFLICCIAALIISGLWKNIDRTYGGGFGSGFLRGAIVFGPLYVLWGWVKSGNMPKPSLEPYQQHTQQPSGDSSIGKWSLWIGVIVGVIWLASKSGNQNTDSTQTSYSSSPATVKFTPPTKQTLPLSTNSSTDEYNLGVEYYDRKDYNQAVYWFRKAAEQGDVDAQYNLGVIYKKGQGVKQNYKQAVYWYRKAAEQGDADAEAALNKIKSKK